MKGRIWLCALCAVMLFILFLPTLISTTIGKNIITNVASEITGFNISADKLSLGWFGSQKLANIRGKSQKGVNIDIDSIEIDRGLLKILTSLSLGKVSLEKPILYIQPKRTYEHTEISTDESLETPEQEETLLLPVDHLIVNNGSVRVVNLDGTITRIDQASIDLQREEGLINLEIAGGSIEGSNVGSFAIDASFSSQSEQNVSFIPFLPVHLNAEVIDFPTKVIDEVMRIVEMPIVLQDLIGPSFNFTLDREKELYTVKVSSNNLNGGGVLKQSGGIFKATNPIVLKWNATPQAINHIFEINEIPLTLNQPTLLNFTLFDLIGNPLEFKSSFQVQSEPASFNLVPDGSILKLESFGLQSKVDLQKDERGIKGTGQLNFNGTPFNLNIEGTTMLEMSRPACLEDCLKGQWDIALDKIPMKLLQVLFHAKRPLDAAFGSHASLDLSLTQKGRETLLGILLKNETINSEWVQFNVTEQNISLKQPIHLQFTPLHPIPLSINGSEYEIDAKEPIHLIVKHLEIANGFSKTAFYGELQSEHLAFGNLPLELHQFKLLLEKKKFSPIDISTNTGIQFLEALQPYLGNSSNLTSSARIHCKEDKASIDPFTLNISSERLKTTADIRISDDYKLTPNSPIYIDYVADSNLPIQTLIQPATIKIEIYPSSSVVDLFNLHASKIKGELHSSPLVIQEKNGTIATLENFESNFDINFPKDEIQISLNGNTGLAGSSKKGTLDINLEITDLIFAEKLSFKTACYKGKMSLDNFPTPLFSPFLHETPTLLTLLGDQFSSTIEGVFLCNQDPKGSMAFKFNSDTIDISSRFKIDGQFIKIYSNPSGQNRIKITLPQMIANKISGTNVEILSPITATANFDYLALPNFVLYDQSIYEIVNQLEGIGSIEMDAISLKGFLLPPMEGSFEFPTGKEPMTLSIHDKNNTDLKLQCSLERPIPQFTHWTDLDMILSFYGKQVPLTLVAEILNVNASVKEQIEVLFDNNAEIRLHLDIKDKEGPVDLYIKGTNCELIAPAFAEESHLKLSDPLTLTVNVTPSVGKSIFGEVVPLLSTVISGSAPMTMTIDPEGFILPLAFNDWKEIQADHGMIDIGVLSLGVDKEIEDILSFLKFNAGSTVEVWATPVYFRVKSQAVTLSRFDFLVANRFPMSLWGKIDFLKNNVNLKLGLGAKTLENVFGIKHLPADFMLPLSLRGPLDDISLDKAKATAKIAALVAESKGSAEGMLLGNLLQLLSGAFKEEEPPKPTTDPLPWASEEAPPKQPSEIKKLLKGLEEGAKSLFKKVK